MWIFCCCCCLCTSSEVEDVDLNIVIGVFAECHRAEHRARVEHAIGAQVCRDHINRHGEHMSWDEVHQSALNKVTNQTVRFDKVKHLVF